MDLSTHVILGKFGKTRGLDGWIRVHSYSDPIENICNYKPWHLDDGTMVLVNNWQKRPDQIYAFLQSHNSIELASQLVDRLIYIRKSQLSPLKKDQYYWFQLENLTVINTHNKCLGTIAHLIPGSQFPLVVVRRDKKNELLIPYEPDVVLKVDLEEQTMIVDWDDY